jgi:hypothetical protein
MLAGNGLLSLGEHVGEGVVADEPVSGWRSFAILELVGIRWHIDTCINTMRTPHVLVLAVRRTVGGGVLTLEHKVLVGFD